MDPSAKIEFDAQPMDCAFSQPGQRPLLAVGRVDGKLQSYEWVGGQAAALLTVEAFKTSCRAVAYAADGKLFAGSEDGSLLVYDTEHSKTICRLTDAHDAPVTRLQIIDEQTFASGDETGAIRMWCLRQKQSTQHLKHHSDYISGLAVHPSLPCLLAASGDGSLSILDRRKSKVTGRSHGDPDDGLESLALLKGGRKIVCGSMTGMLSVYNWGKLDTCDKFPGHPGSVGAMVRLDEDTLVTGCDDGILRTLSIQPNKFLGVLGEDPEGDCTSLALSSDSSLLASTSYGTTVRLWNLEDDSSVDAEPEAAGADSSSDEEKGASSDSSEDSEKPQQPKKKRKKQFSSAQDRSDFFQDL